MRIATFNINNVNKRLANLLAWLAQTKPDVVCLQELKAEDRAFPIAAIEAGEDPANAAVREFEEETGLTCPALAQPLAALRQAGGKTVLCWTAEADLDLSAFRPGQFEMEWPPRSGKRVRFPEIDRLSYFADDEALRRVLPSQAPLIAEVLSILGAAA